MTFFLFIFLNKYENLKMCQFFVNLMFHILKSQQFKIIKKMI
jgi:hypothetical protein